MKKKFILVSVLSSCIVLMAEVFEQSQLPPLNNTSTQKTSQPSTLEAKSKSKKVKKTKKKDMTDQEIDHIFISFSKQREKEKMEREKAALLSTKPHEVRGAKIRNKKKTLVGNPVLPHNPNDVKNMEESSNILSPAEVLKNVLPPEAIATMGENINGVSCDKRGCVAFTSRGVVKKGDFIRPGEKILKITPLMITTSLRKIKI